MAFPFIFQCHACPRTCPEQWQLINIIGMDRCTYNCSILSITFSEAFDGTETNWRMEAAAQQICGKAELLAGKNPWL